MYKKLNTLLDNLSSTHYNDYSSYQPNCSIKVFKYTEPLKYTSLFKNLINLFKNEKTSNNKTTQNNNRKPLITPHPIIRTQSPVNRAKPNEFIQTNPIFSTKPDIFKLQKFTGANYGLDKIIQNIECYSVKVPKRSFDSYSQIFLKAIDNRFCLLPKTDIIPYLKNIKYKVIEYFNKHNYFRLYNYSSKDFKKSDLDNVFASNLSINIGMLKVYANVFKTNLIYFMENKPRFITNFKNNFATVIIFENANDLGVLRKRKGFIRGEELGDILNIDRKLRTSELENIKLPELHNLSRMKNIDIKKQGKTKKINKTKLELINELTVIH